MRTTPSLDDLTALTVMMAVTALYSFCKGAQLFISAIKLLHEINNKTIQQAEAIASLYRAQLSNNSDPSAQDFADGLAQFCQIFPRSRETHLVNAAIGGLLMYNAYSTGSNLVAGENLGIVSTAVNTGIALLGVRDIIKNI